MEMMILTALAALFCARYTLRRGFRIRRTRRFTRALRLGLMAI